MAQTPAHQKETSLNGQDAENAIHGRISGKWNSRLYYWFGVGLVLLTLSVISWSPVVLTVCTGYIVYSGFVFLIWIIVGFFEDKKKEGILERADIYSTLYVAISTLLFGLIYMYSTIGSLARYSFDGPFAGSGFIMRTLWVPMIILGLAMCWECVYVRNGLKNQPRPSQTQ